MNHASPSSSSFPYTPYPPTVYTSATYPPSPYGSSPSTSPSPRPESDGSETSLFLLNLLFSLDNPVGLPLSLLILLLLLFRPYGRNLLRLFRSVPTLYGLLEMLSSPARIAPSVSSTSVGNALSHSRPSPFAPPATQPTAAAAPPS